MRKGDETKQEILQVSERLFCSKGYDETSIQNILDVIHGSKGGFYHHFVSKEDVLRTICQRRAEAAAERAGKAAAETADPLKRLALVLSRFLPFQREDLSFMCMLMPILDRTESAFVRVCYQDALAEAFLPLLREAENACRAADITRPVVPEPYGPVLTLLNACWYEAARLFVRDARGGVKTDPAQLLSLMDTARRCIEALLDAPFGSIALLPLETWYAFAEEAGSRMKFGS